jgi:hypothetical protein
MNVRLLQINRIFTNSKLVDEEWDNSFTADDEDNDDLKNSI